MGQLSTLVLVGTRVGIGIPMAQLQAITGGLWVLWGNVDTPVGPIHTECLNCLYHIHFAVQENNDNGDRC
eukprot:2593562-Rhodomonas_salina.3